jgi:hypothetical protein
MRSSVTPSSLGNVASNVKYYPTGNGRIEEVLLHLQLFCFSKRRLQVVSLGFRLPLLHPRLRSSLPHQVGHALGGVEFDVSIHQSYIACRPGPMPAG